MEVARTDYEAAGYASRFAKARALDAPTRAIWIAELAAVVGKDEIKVALDLGSGTGRFWPVLQAAWHPRSIIAVDNSSQMLRNAPANRTVVRLCADIEDVPIGDSVVDACFCSMVLHYATDPATVCRSLVTIVRPGGVICVRSGTLATVDSFYFLRFFPTALAAEKRVMPTPDELTSYLSNAGFRQIIVRNVEIPIARGYLSYLGAIALRGFPSLQIVPKHEFAMGLIRLTIHSLFRLIRGIHLENEKYVFISGRRV